MFQRSLHSKTRVRVEGSVNLRHSAVNDSTLLSHFPIYCEGFMVLMRLSRYCMRRKNRSLNAVRID